MFCVLLVAGTVNLLFAKKKLLNIYHIKFYQNLFTCFRYNALSANRHTDRQTDKYLPTHGTLTRTFLLKTM